MAWLGFRSLSYFLVSLAPSSKLSVIVVRKRCMPRFFMEQNRTLQNPPLGTVVDSEATHPEWSVLFENECSRKHSLCVQVWPYFICLLSHIHSIFPLRYDFYLVSQAACRGTVNPTHYNVIYDDNGLKPDHMQRLTFKLCHLYYNWPVSDSRLLTLEYRYSRFPPRNSPQFTFVSLHLAQCPTFSQRRNEWMSEWMTDSVSPQWEKPSLSQKWNGNNY